MKSAALLANPDSGSGEAASVADCLRGHGLEVTEFGLDDIDAALASNPELLIAAGGDGSLACVAEPAAKAGLPLAVIPTGTANDFARELEIPLDTEAACELAAGSGSRRALDLALMGDRPFLNVASLGLPPAAARHAQGLKGALGPFAYAVGAVRAGAGATPVSCRVLCDEGEIHRGPAWQVTVACSGAFGGGASIEADPEDRKLDVVVIEAGSRARLVRHAYGLRRGGIGEQPGVRKVRCREASVELTGIEPWNVDGEIVESGTVRFRIAPHRVEVVVG